MPEHTAGGTARLPFPAPSSRTLPDEPDDELLAAILIRMWALASGRSLRRDVPPDQLDPEELIAFWADDLTPQTGRHARKDSVDPAPRTNGQGKPPHPATQYRRRKRRPPRGNAANARQELPADQAAA